MRTLGPLREDIEMDMQTGPMGLLDVMVYFTYRSARFAHNLTVSPWFLQQKSVSDIHENLKLGYACLASNTHRAHCTLEVQMAKLPEFANFSFGSRFKTSKQYHYQKLRTKINANSPQTLLSKGSIHWSHLLLLLRLLHAGLASTGMKIDWPFGRGIFSWDFRP